MLAMVTGHAIEEDVKVFALSGVNQRLDIFGLVFFEYFCRQHIKLPLQQVHQQAAGASVAISPNFKPMKTGAGFSVGCYAFKVYNELLWALDGLVEK